MGRGVRRGAARPCLECNRCWILPPSHPTAVRGHVSLQSQLVYFTLSVVGIWVDRGPFFTYASSVWPLGFGFEVTKRNCVPPTQREPFFRPVVGGRAGRFCLQPRSTCGNSSGSIHPVGLQHQCAVGMGVMRMGGGWVLILPAVSRQAPTTLLPHCQPPPSPPPTPHQTARASVGRHHSALPALCGPFAVP